MAGRRPEATELVSFVMAGWNPRSDWLEEAVRSVLAQRDCSLELVVVDDGSDTPLGEILAGHEDSRLRVVRIEHGGLSRARNAGVAASLGAYVRYVDCDDYFPPAGTARLLALAEARQDVIAYGQTLRCDPELRPISLMRCATEGEAIMECLLGGFPTRHMSMLFPRRIVDAVGEWDPGFPACGDWDYVLRALEHATVRSDPAVVTWYRNHPASMSADLDACTVGMTRAVNRFVERHPQLRGSRLERRALAQVALKIGWSRFDRGEGHQMLPALGQAARLSAWTAGASVARRAPQLARHAAGRTLRAASRRAFLSRRGAS